MFKQIKAMNIAFFAAILVSYGMAYAAPMTFQNTRKKDKIRLVVIPVSGGENIIAELAPNGTLVIDVPIQGFIVIDTAKKLMEKYLTTAAAVIPTPLEKGEGRRYLPSNSSADQALKGGSGGTIEIHKSGFPGKMFAVTYFAPGEHEADYNLDSAPARR